MKTAWKPCDKLTASDFKTSPVWGFDLSREGKPEGADETWVRPYSFSRAPRTTDLLFVSARLQPRDGGSHAGAVTVHFSKGVPSVDGVVLLDPRYCAPTLHEGVVPARERSYVEIYIRNAKDLFPIRYDAMIQIGNRKLPLRGIANLGW
jgi:hypothetical protein